MSCWLWLNTKTNPPCWKKLDKESSDYIQNHYEHGEPTQLHPFYLPKYHNMIRLLPFVQIAMAIECYNNYPLIYNKNKNNKPFGYNINLEQHEDESLIQQNENETKMMDIDLITQKIVFSNQQLNDTDNLDFYTRMIERWYCLGIGEIKNIWYPFDDILNSQIDDNFNNKQESFILETESISLNIRFAVKYNIPFGFASNANVNNKEELLIIKYQFDFFGLINGLNVALYPYEWSLRQRMIVLNYAICFMQCLIQLRLYQDFPIRCTKIQMKDVMQQKIKYLS